MQAKRGTPCYMAPELFQDGSTHSSAADLWALGCVLYECADGHPPFVSTSFNHLVNDILTGDPPALPSKLQPPTRVPACKLGAQARHPSTQADAFDLLQTYTWGSAQPVDLPSGFLGVTGVSD